jgi:hypothetical protein
VRASDGSRLLRKGSVLDDAALTRWAEVAPGVVHLLELAPDDVHEDPAGLRVALAAAGDGIRVKGPIQSRYNLISDRKGLLRIDIGLLRQINHAEGITLFSLLDRQPVLPGKIVAGVKVTPIAVPAANVRAVECIVADASHPPLVVAAGGNTIDPLDPIFLALSLIGGELVHFGAPSHPGSMFWLARVGTIPIFNLASCSMYSRATVADLILPLVMTGKQVTAEDIIDLGYGGLLEREMAFRFPNYDAEASDDEANEAG